MADGIRPLLLLPAVFFHLPKSLFSEQHAIFAGLRHEQVKYKSTEIL